MSDAEPGPAPAFGRSPRSSSPCDACEARVRSFCDTLKGQEFARLAAIVTGRTFQPRQTIVQEGEQADWLFNVVSGTVKLYRTLSDGRVQIVGFLNSGDFMGIPPHARYTVSAEAVTMVETCVFPRRPLDRMMGESPALERRLFELARDEVSAAREHMLLLGRKTAREKVATFLLALAEKGPCRSGEVPAVAVPMIRSEIADYLGLTTETVSRTITSLRESGLIALRATDEVTLVDRVALRRIAEGGV